MHHQIFEQRRLQRRTIDGEGAAQWRHARGPAQATRPQLVGKFARVAKARLKRLRRSFVHDGPVRQLNALGPLRNLDRTRGSRRRRPAAQQRWLCCRDHGTPTLRDLEIPLHRQLIDHAGDGVARQLELAGKLAARRQAVARRERAVQDRLAQFVIELAIQRLAVARMQRDVDHA